MNSTRIFWRIWWLAAVSAALGLYGVSLVMGNLNQDEGWYLIAARRVSEGLWPFRDFAFTQGPVLPLVYGALYGFVSQGGVMGGRLLTALFGLAGCALAAGLAARCAPDGVRKPAAAMGFALAGINLYQVYFTTVVKTYALCSMLLLAGFFVLSFAESGRRKYILSALAGFLMALSAGTRLSAGCSMAVTGIYLLAQGRLVREFRWLAFGVGGMAGLAVVFLPFWLAAPEAALFGWWTYHSMRSSGGGMQSLVFKAGFIVRTIQAYIMIALAAVGWGALRWWQGRDAVCRPGNAAFGIELLLSTSALITLLHLAAPFPYDDYQALVMPLAGAALGAALAKRLDDAPNPSGDGRRARVLCALVLAGGLLTALASPLLQEWMVLRRDRIWWRMKKEPDVLTLRKAAAWLREQPDAGTLLLTQDAYLAVESGLDVPRGLEMGPFSYYPDVSDEQAASMGGVINRDALLRIIASGQAPYAAFSGYGLSIQNPSVTELAPSQQDELWSAVLQHYEPAREIPDFGQGHTTMRILRRKPLQ